MALIIRDRIIYTSDGIALKEIYCPRKVVENDLSEGSDGEFQCHQCAKIVVNTDYMTEDELVWLLRKEPEKCLFVNLANPVFKVEK